MGKIDSKGRYRVAVARSRRLADIGGAMALRASCAVLCDGLIGVKRGLNCLLEFERGQIAARQLFPVSSFTLLPRGSSSVTTVIGVTCPHGTHARRGRAAAGGVTVMRVTSPRGMHAAFTSGAAAGDVQS